MTSVSGLDAHQRALVRREVVRAARLMLNFPTEVHYTQGPQRWEGIDRRLLASKGQFPWHSDCSSSATWMLWNGLHLYGIHDIVNGLNWKAGYTGTMLAHGKVVRKEANIKIGDLAIYGHGFPGSHVAVCLGGGLVFSHGSERGPFLCNLHYRPDLMVVRRYI